MRSKTHSEGQDRGLAAAPAFTTWRSQEGGISHCLDNNLLSNFQPVCPHFMTFKGSDEDSSCEFGMKSSE